MSKLTDHDIQAMIRQSDSTPFPSLLTAALEELQSIRAKMASMVEQWREWSKELEQRSPEGASSWMLAARDLEAILRGE